MTVQVAVIRMLKKEGLAQIYELLYLPADDDIPEYTNFISDPANAMFILTLFLVTHHTTPAIMMTYPFPTGCF